MKKIAFFFLLCLLFDSCFSYKKIDLDRVVFNKKDLLKITTLNNDMEKGRFHSGNDSLVTFISRNGKLRPLSLREIKEVKKRKFSLVKTIVLPTIIGVITIIVGKEALSNGGLGLGEFSFAKH